MQQPPYGRPPQPPGSPPRPAGPPPGYPPQAAVPPRAQPPLEQRTPVPPALPPVPPRRNRAALRFVASTCVGSAWITLLASILFAWLTFAAGSRFSRASSGTQYVPRAGATAPGGSGLEGLGGLGGGAGGQGGLSDLLGGPQATPPDLGGLLSGGTGGGGALGMLGGGLLSGFFIASAIGTLVMGVVGFFLFLGMGQACYALLDLEEQSQQMAQTLQFLAARLGGGR